MQPDKEEQQPHHNWNRRIKKPAWPMYVGLAILSILIAYLLSST